MCNIRTVQPPFAVHAVRTPYPATSTGIKVRIPYKLGTLGNLILGSQAHYVYGGWGQKLSSLSVRAKPINVRRTEKSILTLYLIWV
jgi:hypothetical protein